MDKHSGVASLTPAAEGDEYYNTKDIAIETRGSEFVGKNEGAYIMSQEPGSEAITKGPDTESRSGSAKVTPWRAKFNLWKRRFSDRNIVIAATAALAQVVVSIVIESVIAHNHGKFMHKYQLPSGTLSNDSVKANSSALMVYYGIFNAGQIFYFLLLVMSIVNGSFVEYVASVVVSGILLLYSFIQAFQSYEVARATVSALNLGAEIAVPDDFSASRTLFITICAALFLNTAIQACLSRKIENAFGWRTFRELGADLNTKKRLKLYQVYIVLLKLSVVFFIGFDIQFLLLPSRKESQVTESNKSLASVPTTIHFIISLPVTVCAILIAHYAQKKESKILMTITVVILQMGSVYLGIKIYDVIHPPSDNPNKYIGSKNSILFFEVTALILAQLTCYIGITNCLSFGKGLMSLVEKSNRDAMELESTPTPTYYYKQSTRPLPRPNSQIHPEQPPTV